MAKNVVVEEFRDASPEELVGKTPEELVDLYLRRSKKRETVETLRQHARDLRREMERQGLTVRKVWLEQRSASKQHVRREKLDKAMAAVMAGEVKTLAVWKTDRFDRRGMAAVGAALDEFDRRRARLYVLQENLDSSQPGNRIVFAILAERARDEIKDLTLRVTTGKTAARTAGRWPGGRTPYGVRSPLGSGRIEPDPAEYPHARRIADELLAGKSAMRVAHGLNHDAIRTRDGARWDARTITRMVRSPAWAGLLPAKERLHDEFGQPLDVWLPSPDPVRDAEGNPVVIGVGVVSPGERLRILTLFEARITRMGGGSRGKRPHTTFLGGFLSCPHCRKAMNGSGGKGNRMYRCRTRLTYGAEACPGVVVRAPRIDAAVEAMWLSHVTALDHGSAGLDAIVRRWAVLHDVEKQARREDVMAALDAAKQRRDKLEHDFYVEGMLAEGRFKSLWADQSAAIESLEIEAAELVREADLSIFFADGEALAEAWAESTIEDRRMLLGCVMTSLTIIPARSWGDRTPMLDRLVPEWVA
ncbi:recombinase family protein [Streptomyces jumonjinensis]|uniref:Recombinase family protein n=1 Tax=Streptomyces jumonjinensis TaxID=1945 RepID=A0A646KRA3_STRJU|nr:recombinase family protein [Streptomyces jumonjinensis]MQT04783.1 recombinase family protein [Streptomyces jumonjinensis]